MCFDVSGFQFLLVLHPKYFLVVLIVVFQFSVDLRSCCDMMYLFFLLDEYTDRCDRIGAQMRCDPINDAFENPDKPRPDGEHVLGEMSRQ